MTPIINLPMYDWPETLPAMDALFNSLKESFEQYGIETAASLDRTDSLNDQWLSGKLLLGQTCGFPYFTTLRDKVHIVGSGTYRHRIKNDGQYCSVLIKNSQCPDNPLDRESGFAFAANSRDSLSGYIAPLAWMLNFYATARISNIDYSGSHRESIQMVASGQADIAAIDSISWEFALRHEPAAKHTKVIAQTSELPGLPFICSKCFSSLPIYEIFSAALNNCSDGIRKELLLDGISPATDEDYAILEDILRDAQIFGTICNF